MPTFALPRITVEGLIIALLLAAVMWQTFRIEGFNFWPIHIRGLEEQVRSARADRDKYKRDLDDLAEQSKRKIEETGKTVDRVVWESKRNPDAERLERAPLPGNCRTPDAVMGADL